MMEENSGVDDSDCGGWLLITIIVVMVMIVMRLMIMMTMFVLMQL